MPGATFSNCVNVTLSTFFLSIVHATSSDLSSCCDSYLSEAARFLKNVKESVKQFDEASGPSLEKKEQLIIQSVLPLLEESWRKPDSSSREVVYETLAKISYIRASPKVVRYTLQMLHRLMLFDNLESNQGNLLGVEEIVRLSICSSDATFQKEGLREKDLRLSVYRRILTLLIFQQIRGWLFTVDIEKTKLLQLQDRLAKYTNQGKGSFQFSIVFIQEAIRYLLKLIQKSEKSNVQAFLNECQANIETQGDNSERLSFLHKLENPKWVKEMILKKKNVNKNSWLAVHCVILYFYEKVSKTRGVVRIFAEGGGEGGSLYVKVKYYIMTQNPNSLFPSCHGTSDIGMT